MTIKTTYDPDPLNDKEKNGQAEDLSKELINILIAKTDDEDIQSQALLLAYKAIMYPTIGDF